MDECCDTRFLWTNNDVLPRKQSESKVKQVGPALLSSELKARTLYV